MFRDGPLHRATRSSSVTNTVHQCMIRSSERASLGRCCCTSQVVWRLWRLLAEKDVSLVTQKRKPGPVLKPYMPNRLHMHSNVQQSYLITAHSILHLSREPTEPLARWLIMHSLITTLTGPLGACNPYSYYIRCLHTLWAPLYLD